MRLPFSLPTLFAATTIALPAAVGGALLAEWLATGKGLGSLMLRATTSSRFGIVWTGAVVIVAASIAGYSAVGFLEGRVANALGSGAPQPRSPAGTDTVVTPAVSV